MLWVLKRTTKKEHRKLVFNTDYRLMQVKSIAVFEILSPFIQLPFFIKTFVLSISEWPLKTGLTVHVSSWARGLLLDPSLLISHTVCKRAGPEVIKLFSCSTQLRTKFQLLIKTITSTNGEVSCFKSLRCCIHHAYKC